MTGTYAGQFVMEGFLDFTLPVWQRVLITRSIAIVPALGVVFFNSGSLTKMDFYLNVLQSVQLPFALIPLIKFVGSKDIMGDFAMSKNHVRFASIFGFLLFVMNFVELAHNETVQESPVWAKIIIVILAIIYVMFILTAIKEPLSPLKELSKS